ncbi:MAG: addiction module protein [Hyphomicrobium sp.]|uniref:addiction module protein n=1 Tax=Hyphomicrobium sp. TaxID=82 RepID=UPI001325D7A1|nr:addiction module protein [Hyphomicrobium sp.]KAB2942515.1 MAG: addiction module protein [Hyphomicrobium sp.]MBZ0208482.1 addiction module protein [Hyphomicrobium sp.]MCZ7594664.1 addiction module protein [Hyphomicrobium sp.]
MNERVKRLTEEIRKLPPEEQAELIDELVVLTYREPDPEVDAAWAEEAECRLAAIRSGQAQTIPLEEVMERLRKRFGRVE